MKLMSVMLVLTALLLFFASAAGIWRPAFLRLRRRRHATMLAGFAFVIMGFGVDLDPPPGNDGPIGSGMLALWVFCCLSGWGILRIVRIVRDERRARPAGERPPLLRIEEPATSSHPEVAAFRDFSVTRKNDARKMATAKARPVKRGWQDGEAGTTASFTYVDSNGVVTDRVIANWRSEGPYIRGFCLDQADHRTFRKDRIEDWRS